MTQHCKHQLLSGLLCFSKTTTGRPHKAQMTTRPHRSWFPTIRVHHSSANWRRIRAERGLASWEMAVFLWCYCQCININEPCHLKRTLWLNERGEIVRGCKSRCAHVWLHAGVCMSVCTRVVSVPAFVKNSDTTSTVLNIRCKTFSKLFCTPFWLPL